MASASQTYLDHKQGARGMRRAFFPCRHDLLGRLDPEHKLSSTVQISSAKIDFQVYLTLKGVLVHLGGLGNVWTAS